MKTDDDTFESIGTVAERVVRNADNPWAWWQAALRGNFGPIHSEPQQGYYRVRGKDGQWEPVAIWIDEGGAWLALRAGREVRDVEQLWTFACRFPIEHNVYEKAMAGGGFDDEPPAPIGDNSGDLDPFEALRIEYLGEKEQAEEFMKQPVKTQAQADKVAIWSKRLTAIKTKAEGLHKVEKQPHLDAGRAVDDKWRDLKSDPDELAKQLKAHIKPFLQEQARAEENRQRKAREDAERIRRAADEERIAAEKAMAKKVADGISDAAAIQEHNNRMAEAERQARAAEADAEARKVNAGRTGARVSMRTVKVGVVTDYAKAATALVAMRHNDMTDLIDKLAQRAATAGMPFDGMEIKEEEKVV